MFPKNTTEGGQVRDAHTSDSNPPYAIRPGSKPEFDVSQVALNFGGGGHAAAAGASIKGSLEDIQKGVLTATKSILELDLVSLR